MTSGIPAQKQQLEDAFLVFNQVSEQLVDSYRQLQQRVGRLSDELAAARSERMIQLAEKERLANRLSTLLDGLPAAVLLVDGGNMIERFNPAAIQLFPEMRAGQHWGELSRAAFEAGQTGKERWLRNGRLVSFTERSLVPEPGRILLMLDITETRELRERIERQQRLSAMGEMAAQLAHQIRTPLSSALLYTAHLARADLSAEQRQRFSSRCRDRLLHMERQINDMLAFARGGQMAAEPIGIQALLTELYQSIEPLFKQRNARISFIDHTDGDEVICGNRDALLGALSNLATNALEHGGEGVCLEMELLQDDQDFILIRFQDDGPGISSEAEDHLFDPFFTTRADGTGLGLAVVQSVVLNHHGHIDIATSRQGGACFELRFPATLQASGGEKKQPVGEMTTHHFGMRSSS